MLTAIHCLLYLLTYFCSWLIICYCSLFTLVYPRCDSILTLSIPSKMQILHYTACTNVANRNGEPRARRMRRKRKIWRCLKSWWTFLLKRSTTSCSRAPVPKASKMYVYCRVCFR